MQNNSVNKGIFHIFNARIWVPMPVYRGMKILLDMSLIYYHIHELYIHLSSALFKVYLLHVHQKKKGNQLSVIYLTFDNELSFLARE